MPLDPYVPGDKTFAEMYTMFQSPEFRQPCEMCVRRQATFQLLQDENLQSQALAKGIIGDSWMDIESVMSAVSTDPDGHLTIGDDALMFQIVEKVWPVVAAARYPGVSPKPPEEVPYEPPIIEQEGVVQYPPPNSASKEGKKE